MQPTNPLIAGAHAVAPSHLTPLTSEALPTLSYLVCENIHQKTYDFFLEKAQEAGIENPMIVANLEFNRANELVSKALKSDKFKAKIIDGPVQIKDNLTWMKVTKFILPLIRLEKLKVYILDQSQYEIFQNPDLPTATELFYEFDPSSSDSDGSLD